MPTCEGLLDPAGLRHLHGHSGGDAPRAAHRTTGEGGTWRKERAKFSVQHQLSKNKSPRNRCFCFFLSFFLLIKDPDEEYLERGAKKSKFHHSQTQTNL